ncbi:MAG: LexA family transcriptional regulator [Firmicutes bacterium]|nr:LexA family transcriptional regulator [Bacillota bacterium]
MRFATRLKELRRKHNLTQVEFAKIFDIGLATVAMWESSQRRPPAKMLMRIADYFRTSVDYLLGVGTKSEEIITLPVLAGVQAGFGSSVNEIESGEFQEIPNSILGSRRADDLLVLRVEGDSMYPKFIDGDRVLVLKQESVDSGDIAIICYEDFENGTIKKVHYETGCDYVDLIPLNPKYSPVRVQDEQLEGMRVIGKVIYLFREI